MKIYHYPDGRAFVMIEKKAIPYARYLMEQRLGRKLNDDEEVHHIDHDKTNDVIENLEVVNSTEHRKHHNPLKYKDTIEQCYICGKSFTFTAKQHCNKYRERNRKPDTVDKYFCSRRCSGIYGKKIQEHLQEKSVE